MNYIVEEIVAYMEENFPWNLTIAISLTANSLNLNCTYYHIFRNLSMIVYMYMIENQK